MSKKVALICPICKKEFIVPLSWSHRKCCSKPCKNKMLKKTMKGKNSKPGLHKKCETCNASFIVQPHRAKARFCSHSCSREPLKILFLADNSSKYKDGRWSYRRLAFNKLEPLCSICGIGGRLEVHHIDQDRTNNKLENLQLVCSKCHKSLHPRS